MDRILILALTEHEEVMEAMEKMTERFQLAVTDAWLSKVDDWRFANRVGSRAAAIRQLVDKGMNEEMATTGDKIGVTAPVDAGNNTRKERCDAART